MDPRFRGDDASLLELLPYHLKLSQTFSGWSRVRHMKSPEYVQNYL